MIHQSDQPIRKYDIWLADLPAVPESHVQSGVRPVIVVSNDVANTHSPIISIVFRFSWAWLLEKEVVIMSVIFSSRVAKRSAADTLPRTALHKKKPLCCAIYIGKQKYYNNSQ